MKKPWGEMTDTEKLDEYQNAEEGYRIAQDYIKWLEGLLDRLADANTTFLETVQQYDIKQESIDDATGVLLDVVAEIVEKHMEEPEPREP